MATTERNLAALMREDCRTIQVVFGGAAEIDDESDDARDEVRIDNSKPKLYVAEQRRPGRSYAISPDRTGRRYTYVTDIKDLAVGDTVVVPVKSTIALAFVVQVDDECEIEPDDSTEYKWVIAKIDMAPYEANLRRNAEIVSLLGKAKKSNMRKVFRSLAIESLGDKAGALLGLAAPASTSVPEARRTAKEGWPDD